MTTRFVQENRYDEVSTDRQRRIAIRETSARDAMQARHDEIATLGTRTTVRKIRPGGRTAKLASMLEFAEVFGVDITSATLAESPDTLGVDPTQDVASVDSFAAPVVTITLSPTAKPNRLARLNRLSARIMRREAKAHRDACYGSSWNPGMILSRRGLAVCEAIIRAESSTGGSGLRTVTEFGNVEGTRHLDRLRLIERIDAERKARRAPKGWDCIDGILT